MEKFNEREMEAKGGKMGSNTPTQAEQVFIDMLAEAGKRAERLHSDYDELVYDAMEVLVMVRGLLALGELEMRPNGEQVDELLRMMNLAKAIIGEE